MHGVLLYVYLYILFVVGYLVDDGDGRYIDIYFVACIYFTC
jgi:hypothetical protein